MQGDKISDEEYLVAKSVIHVYNKQKRRTLLEKQSSCLHKNYTCENIMDSFMQDTISHTDFVCTDCGYSWVK